MTYDPNRDLFGSFRNPDGTYDGRKLMSALTGIPEDEVQKTWENVKDAREQYRGSSTEVR